jgi:hypothetical protein
MADVSLVSSSKGMTTLDAQYPSQITSIYTLSAILRISANTPMAVTSAPALFVSIIKTRHTPRPEQSMVSHHIVWYGMQQYYQTPEGKQTDVSKDI